MITYNLHGNSYSLVPTASIFDILKDVPLFCFGSYFCKCFAKNGGDKKIMITLEKLLQRTKAASKIRQSNIETE